MSSWMRSGVALGFALGGFFDGILLHQILQWHHLLSLVRGVADLRMQVLWDGYFHALMYLIALVALWGLWRSRHQPDAGGRALVAAALLGFGAWHVVDALLSHWLLGIHRIRIDSPNPLFWDLLWLGAFGIAPAIAGWWLSRRQRAIALARHAGLPLFAAALLTGGAAAWSLQPPVDQRFTTVVFAPGITPAQAMNAIVAADGLLAWADPDMRVVVVQVSREQRLRFYRHGALLVSGSGLPDGCFGWSRAEPVRSIA